MIFRRYGFVMLLGLLAGAVSPAKAAPYRLMVLEHRTDSDWSTFSFSSDNLVVAMGGVVENADHPGITSVTPTFISQTIDGRVPITVRITVRIPDTVTSLTLNSEKGGLGVTSFKITNVDPPIVWENATSGTDRNPAAFTLSADDLARLPEYDPADNLFDKPVFRRCTVVLETTSDWSHLEILSDRPALLSFDRIVQSESPGQLYISDAGVNKNVAFDDSYAKLEFSLFLDDDLPQTLIINSTKGNIGTTTVTLMTDRVLKSYTHTAPSVFYSFDTQPLGGVPVTTLGDDRFDPRILAFYYTWYGAPDGPEGARLHWPEGYTHTPLLGEYSSRTDATLAAHVNWIRQAGIDSLILTWWGPNDYTDVTARDYLLPYLVKNGITDITVTLYLEAASSTDDLYSQLAYIYDTYGNHPNFLRVDGKPVVFFYGRVMGSFSLDEFAQVFKALEDSGRPIFTIADSLSPYFLSVFDGLHTYNPVGTVLNDPASLAHAYQAACIKCRLAGKLFVATVLPGYDDSHLPARPISTILPREDGQTYRSTWADAYRSFARWAAVCSFNELHEGSEIEPTQEEGTAYIELTRTLGDAFRARDNACTDSWPQY